MRRAEREREREREREKSPRRRKEDRSEAGRRRRSAPCSQDDAALTCGPSARSDPLPAPSTPARLYCIFSSSSSSSSSSLFLCVGPASVRHAAGRPLARLPTPHRLPRGAVDRAAVELRLSRRYSLISSDDAQQYHTAACLFPPLSKSFPSVLASVQAQ